LCAVAAALCLIGVLWLPPPLATLTHSRALPAMSASEAIAGTVTVAAKGRWSDPAAAYPARARERMPAGSSWWLSAAAPVGLLIAIAAAPRPAASASPARRGFLQRAPFVQKRQRRRLARSCRSSRKAAASAGLIPDDSGRAWSRA
jgi:hypothetical protein